MPKRTHSHRVRDIASLAVEIVFATHGWATEPILKDYGIDLLVQPCYFDDVEEFKLWVQVKGVDRMDDADAWRVSVKHARDWVRSKEYVVFVVWNLNTHTGEFCLPRHQIAGSTLPTDGETLMRLRSDGAFDAEALRKLQLIALLDHYHHRIMARKLNWAWQPLQGPLDNVQQTFARAGRDVFQAGSELMVRLGILGEEAGRCILAPELIVLWRTAESHVELLNRMVAENLDIDTARLTLAIALWIHTKTCIAAPLDVAHTVAQVVNLMVESGFVSRLAVEPVVE